MTLHQAVRDPHRRMPPLRLLLGKAALDLARNKLAQLGTDFDAWEATTAGADFPKEG